MKPEEIREGNMENRFEFERTRTVWNLIPAVIIWTTFNQIELSWLCWSMYYRYKI